MNDLPEIIREITLKNINDRIKVGWVFLAMFIAGLFVILGTYIYKPMNPAGVIAVICSAFLVAFQVFTLVLQYRERKKWIANYRKDKK